LSRLVPTVARASMFSWNYITWNVSIEYSFSEIGHEISSVCKSEVTLLTSNISSAMSSISFSFLTNVWLRLVWFWSLDCKGNLIFVKLNKTWSFLLNGWLDGWMMDVKWRWKITNGSIIFLCESRLDTFVKYLHDFERINSTFLLKSETVRVVAWTCLLSSLINYSMHFHHLL